MGESNSTSQNYTVEEKQVKNAEIRQKNCPLYKGIFDNDFIAIHLVRKLYPNVMLCGQHLKSVKFCDRNQISLT